MISKPGGTTRRPKSGKYVTDLDFADDIALISNCVKNAQKMLLSVEKWALTVGLIINSTKTVFLLSGKWRTSSIKIKLSFGYVLKKLMISNIWKLG